MYSPKIREDLIPYLYRLGQTGGKPMTAVVDSFLRPVVLQVCEQSGEGNEHPRAKVHWITVQRNGKHFMTEMESLPFEQLPSRLQQKLSGELVLLHLADIDAAKAFEAVSALQDEEVNTDVRLGLLLLSAFLAQSLNFSLKEGKKKSSDSREKVQQPASKKARTVKSGPATKPGEEKMSGSQYNYLMQLLSQNRGISAEEARSHLKSYFSVESLQDIGRAQASRLIEELIRESKGK